MFEDDVTGEGREQQTGTGATGSGASAAGASAAGDRSSSAASSDTTGAEAPMDSALFDVPVDDLDAAGVLEALCGTQEELVDRECRLLELAGQWIDVHGPDDPATDNAATNKSGDGDGDGDSGPGAGRRRSRRALPGMEGFVRVGAPGTPLIGEFACAEFAAVQDLHPLAGRNRLAQVANLRHRHPLLWARVRAREVRGWKALEVAKRVGSAELGLTTEQARWIDARTAHWIDKLAWGRFLDKLEATIIAADPRAARMREELAAADQYVTTGQSNEYGLKTLIAKANAGDVIYFQAMCDRIAALLADRGDTRPIGVRRAAAIGILANPVRAYRLLTGTDETDTDAGAGAGSHNGTGVGSGTGSTGSTGSSGNDVDRHDANTNGGAGAGTRHADGHTDSSRSAGSGKSGESGELDLFDEPGEDLTDGDGWDSPAPDAGDAEVGDDEPVTANSSGGHNAGEDPGVEAAAGEDRHRGDACGEDGGGANSSAHTSNAADPDPAADPSLDRREHLGELTASDVHPREDDSDDPPPGPCPACHGAGRLSAQAAAAFTKPDLSQLDLAKLRPRAVLYVHLTDEALKTQTGVARVEGYKPITVPQVAALLKHAHVRVVPVLDLAGQPPADAYEFTGRLREAVELIHPGEAFPYSAYTGRRVDIDHSIPYRPPDHGGPPGQTHTGNAAKLKRFSHRLKTHGRWRQRQPAPGVYLWRSPHGYYWLDDPQGTHKIDRHLGEILWHALDPARHQSA